MKENKKITAAKRQIDYDFDKNYYKYVWVLIPCLTIIYFSYSFFSNGFYQDDEITHFMNMRDFWSNPFIIMSNWGKPGWKIFLELPSLGGYRAVLFFNSFITALTAYFTVLLAKELKFKNAILAGIFFAFQPLILQLSFRSYAEIFTGLLLVLTLYFFYKNNYYISALICGLSFTVRQESALLCVVLAVFMIINKKYLPVLLIAVFPFIMNLIGFIHTGDQFWAWTEMKNLGEFNLGIDRSFFHYFGVYIYIIGPVVFSLFILGIVSPFFIKNKTEFYKKESIIYLFFFIVFLFQCYLVAKGTNPGSWRYLLQVSPFAAIIGLSGFNDIFDSKKKYVVPVLGIIALLIFAFLSRESTGLLLTDKAEFTKLFAVLILISGVIFIIKMAKNVMFSKFILLTIILTIGFTFYSEKPKQEVPENIAVRQISDWYNKNTSKAIPVLYNHSLILFYANITGDDKNRFKILNRKTLDESPKGTIIIWDTHYSYRPEYKNDTQLDYLGNNQKNYKLLTQFTSTDKRFEAYIFEKL